jgi:hypothetical protein
MASVYRKTEKGLAEIETRAHRLAPRLRSALIMVDGKRNDDELRKLILSDPDGALKSLLDEGYVEVISITPQRPAPPPPPAPEAGAAAAQAAAAGQRALDDVRKKAIRMLMELVGPVAEAVAMKMEKAHNWEELRHSLEIGRDILQNTRGSTAAKEFSERFLPPGT